MDKITLLTPKNQNQKDFQQSLQNNIVTIANGCAGVGKTLLAINFALAGLSSKSYEKIVYIRPDVGVDYQRGRGALPGEKFDKSLPLLAPLLDNLSVFCQEGLKKYLLEKELIEYIYLEDIRGRSLNDTFAIFDEAQNSTIEQFKTVLTRIGAGSTLAILGDTTQVDVMQIKYNNGLLDASNRLMGLKNVGIINFTVEDIVRSPILKHVLRRYSPPKEDSYEEDMRRYVYNQ